MPFLLLWYIHIILGEKRPKQKGEEKQKRGKKKKKIITLTTIPSIFFAPSLIMFHSLRSSSAS
jgi:hypothetical protein